MSTSKSTNAPTTAGEASTTPAHPPSRQAVPDEPRDRDLPPRDRGLDPNSAVVSHAKLADTRRKEMREDLDVVLSHGSHPHHKPLQRDDKDAWVSGERGKEHVQTVQVEANRPPIVGHVAALDQQVQAQPQVKSEFESTSVGH